MDRTADKASKAPSTSLALLGHPMYTRSRRHYSAEVRDHAEVQELYSLHLALTRNLSTAVPISGRGVHVALGHTPRPRVD